MTMTATELYELVKDVPREAWPDEIEWDTHLIVFGCPHYPDWRLLENHAVLLFEASMSRWLEEKTGGIQLYWKDDGKKRRHRVQDLWVVPNVKGEGPTRLHALAAACKEKEVAGG